MTDSSLHPSTDHTVTAPTTGTVRRAVTAAGIGNFVEWFDFSLYAYLATTVGQAFFPDASRAAQLISTFAVLAISFVFRPLGGVFFGSLGDRLGRRKVLAATLLLMCGSTFAIGLIPSHATIGLGAPLLLVVARVVQGFATGGEYGSAATFIAEYAPDRRRGFVGSFLEVGTLTGLSTGAAVAAVVTSTLPAGDLASWGWRLPFLIAGPLGLIGVYLRTRLEDTPIFTEAKQAEQTTATPLRTALQTNWRRILDVVGIVVLVNVAYYTLLTYLPTYFTELLHLSGTEALLVSIAMMLTMVALVTPIGALSDHVGRKPLLIAAGVTFLLASYPAFLLLDSGTRPGLFAGLALLVLPLSVIAATIPSTLPALFPTEIRCGAFAMSYNVSTALFGGTAPFVIQSLTTLTGSRHIPAYYLVAAAAVALVPLLRMTETARRSLRTPWRGNG